MNKKTLLSLLGAVSVALSAVIAYVTSQPDDTTNTGGGGKAGSVAVVDAGSPMVRDAGTTLPPPVVTTAASVGIQTWFVDPGWSGEALFVNKVPGAWSSTFLDQLRPFSTIRHMDDNAVNCSKQTSWSARRQPSDQEQTAYGARDGSGAVGVAYEYQIDMCNMTNNDCWFVVPERATDAYVTSLAQLVNARLSKSLNAYVEWSNETWNGAFCASAYAQAQGAALKLPGQNQYYVEQAYTVLRALQVGKLFKAVMPLVKLVYSFSGNYDAADQALTNVYKANMVPGVTIDMLAIAPYIGLDNGLTSWSLSNFKKSVDNRVSTTSRDDTIPMARAIAKRAGVAVLGCYEAGASYYGSQSVLFSMSPESTAAYTYFLDKVMPLLNGPCNLYTHASEYKNDTAWGLYSNKGVASPRVAAVQSWISSHVR